MKRFFAAVIIGAPLMAMAGTWQPLVNQPPVGVIINPNNSQVLSAGGASFPVLLTDGSVLVRDIAYFFGDARVFKLTPDAFGSYVNGTWSQVASMPYISSGSAEAVLPDGRLIVEGGEFTGTFLNFTLTNQGAIYNPVTDSWTSVSPPAFFVDLYPPRATFAPHPIGDAACIVLADGTFMVQDKMSRQAAALNLKTMTWTEVGTATKADLNDEEGWTLLPNGKVLTVDCYTDFAFGLISSYPADPTNSEIFDPSLGIWMNAGSTINTLTDPILFETGPAVLRPDGTVFALGSQGYSSIYNTHTGTWSAGPRLPISDQGYQLTVQDGAGALLPNGNVLVSASGGPPNPNNGQYSDPPLYFYEFDGTQFIREPTIPNAAIDQSFSPVMLVLPTGQILEADSTGDVEIYTPDDRSHNPLWEPVVLLAPFVVSPGGSYTIRGFRFNGMSQASAFGDECQNATNYPLVRITNLRSHHVFYSRTHNHSSMAVASNKLVSTTFDVPGTQELGLSKLEVVANGIASPPVFLQVAYPRRPR